MKNSDFRAWNRFNHPTYIHLIHSPPPFDKRRKTPLTIPIEAKTTYTVLFLPDRRKLSQALRRINPSEIPSSISSVESHLSMQIPGPLGKMLRSARLLWDRRAAANSPCAALSSEPIYVLLAGIKCSRCCGYRS